MDVLGAVAVPILQLIVGIAGFRFATKACWACGDRLMRATEVCPHCGRPQSHNKIDRGHRGVPRLIKRRMRNPYPQSIKPTFYLTEAQVMRDYPECTPIPLLETLQVHQVPETAEEILEAIRLRPSEY